MMKALALSVGIGRGVEHGIVTAIQASNPDLIAYFVSEASMDTIPLVESLLEDEYEVKTWTVVDANDFERCYHDAKEMLQDIVERGYDSSSIAVDFTSGTKPMSSGLVLAAVSLGCSTISYVAGTKRDENGRVVSGSERRMSLSPVEVVADRRMRGAIQLFNRYQFDAVCSIIDDMRELTSDMDILGDFMALQQLARAYAAFDKFNHEKALEYLKNMDKDVLDEWDIDLYDNKALLHQEKECNHYCIEYIIDLVANAQRRGEEGKYDDAVARLYRVIELLAQTRLWSEYNIDSSDVDVNRIPDNYRGLYERMGNGRISLPLKQSYMLLRRLGDPIGEDFFEHEKLLGLLNARNNSILAHGINPVSQHQYEQMMDMVVTFIRKHVGDIDFARARFPEIQSV